jgi:DNA-binding CsgD family transcriptional regulator
VADVIDPLKRGREAFATRGWRNAYEWLSRADSEAPLGVEDLQLLATAAYMIGRDDDYVHGLERACQAYLDAGEVLRAARCAFWAGLCLAFRGEMGPATGWFGRAQRLVRREGGDCVERGYLLIPVVKQHEQRGDFGGAYSAATEMAEIAERHRDADLHAIAVHGQGRALIRDGEVAKGLGLLDEVMVAVSGEELSPIVTGLMYCSVIDGCREAFALRRAREWTAALSGWCEEQPDMVSFTGRCLVHRAEIMQLHGSWADALVEAGRARERFAQGANPGAAGEAHYRRGELYRLRGELEAAEDAYREASRCGREPQPGLALLRMTQGRTEAASAAMRRLAAETAEPIERAALLPAHVEILLAAGDVDEALAAGRELAALAECFESELLDALAAQTDGSLGLAEGDVQAALVPLRQALQAWQELGVPYEAARVRVLVARACRALGDEDTAALELEAAREIFAELGAAPDTARVDSLSVSEARTGTHGLTARELQVLRLVATGETNKAIAAELVLSERTVDRHVSNILAKVGASSRAAATAYAYEHQLV